MYRRPKKSNAHPQCVYRDMRQRVNKEKEVPYHLFQYWRWITEINLFINVSIDIKGPMDSPRATIWPEAVPLKDITTTQQSTIIIYNLFLEWVQLKKFVSDNGRQLIPKDMQEVMVMFGILTDFYLLFTMFERFDISFTKMVLKLCREKPKMWGQTLTAVLYAYREIPNTSCAYSRFFLTFGDGQINVQILSDMYANKDNISDEYISSVI